MSDQMPSNVLYVEAEKNFIELTWESGRNAAATAREGRPIHDKLLMLKIRCPGAKNAVQSYELERHLGDGTVIRNESVYQRFAPQIDRFKASEAAPDVGGTPLSEMPGLEVHQVAMLKGVGIYNVEGLAVVEDGNLRHLGMGARALRERAKSYLESAAGAAPVSRLAAENETLRADVERLTAQVAELAKLAEKAQAGGDDERPARRGPGRPRKAEAEAA